jgi:transcriptional regulator GlxA family with amidase domain
MWFHTFLYLHFGSALLHSPVVTASTNRRNTSLPVDFGMVVFPSFEAIDVFGPLEVFNLASLSSIRANLFIIAPTLDPVSTKPQVMNVTGSNFGQSIVPTHTFANPPENLDVLFVPGGVGTRSLNTTQSVVEFIKRTYPRVDFLVTGCTGSSLVARTGILDGRRATGNKRSWAFVTSQGPKVNWVPSARWVVDGNIWSSSGVSAFIDVTFAWLEAIFGSDIAVSTADGMEYERHTDPSWDPYSDLYGLNG